MLNYCSFRGYIVKGSLFRPLESAGIKMQKQTTDQAVRNGTDDRSEITIGKMVFIVRVQFGKIPLEDILRQRITRECALKPQ